MDHRRYALCDMAGLSAYCVLDSNWFIRFVGHFRVNISVYQRDVVWNCPHDIVRPVCWFIFAIRDFSRISLMDGAAARATAQFAL